MDKTVKEIIVKFGGYTKIIRTDIGRVSDYVHKTIKNQKERTRVWNELVEELDNYIEAHKDKYDE